MMKYIDSGCLVVHSCMVNVWMEQHRHSNRHLEYELRKTQYMDVNLGSRWDDACQKLHIAFLEFMPKMVGVTCFQVIMVFTTQHCNWCSQP